MSHVRSGELKLNKNFWGNFEKPVLEFKFWGRFGGFYVL